MKVHGEDILTLPSSSPSLALVLCSPQFYFPYSDGGLPGCTLPLSKWTPRCVHHTQRQPICLGAPVGHPDVPTRPSQSWHCPGHVISGSLTPIWPEPHPQGCPRPPCLSRSWRPRDLCPTPTSLCPSWDMWGLFSGLVDGGRGHRSGGVARPLVEGTGKFLEVVCHLPPPSVHSRGLEFVSYSLRVSQTYSSAGHT